MDYSRSTANVRDQLIKSLKEYKPSFRNKSDAVIVALHLVMKTLGFECLGCEEGVEQTIAANQLTPPDWNKSSDSYCFRYKYKENKHFTIKSLVLGEKLLVNGFNSQANTIHSYEVNVNEFIKEGVSLDDYENLYMNLENLVSLFKINIINKLLPEFVEKTQTSSRREEDYDPLRVPGSGRQPRSPLMDPMSGGFGYRGMGGAPFGIGSHDIYPSIPGPPMPGGMFGPGGNLIGPNHPGFGPGVMDPYSDPNATSFPWPQGPGGRGMPRGGPPGARFDPFGPPGFNNSEPEPEFDGPPPMYL